MGISILSFSRNQKSGSLSNKILGLIYFIKVSKLQNTSLFLIVLRNGEYHLGVIAIDAAGKLEEAFVKIVLGH